MIIASLSFPAWIRITHYINLLFIGLLIRSGLCMIHQIPDLLTQKPIGLEGFDDRLIDDLKKKGLHPGEVALFPPGKGWLIVEFCGQNKEEAKEQAQRLMDALKGKEQAPQMRLFDDPAQQAMIWSVRESALRATAVVPGEDRYWPGWEDSAVPPDKLGNYLRDLRKLFDSYGYQCCFYGHFGQGCLHGRIDFDLETQAGLSEFLEQKAPLYAPPHLKRKALVHGHCHHKAIMKMRDEQAVLEKMGLDVQLLDSGCCGMAGAFGFEKDHYDVSVKVGECVLLPVALAASGLVLTGVMLAWLCKRKSSSSRL